MRCFISGVVTNLLGQPVEGARVFLEVDEVGEHVVRTDEQGRFHLVAMGTSRPVHFFAVRRTQLGRSEPVLLTGGAYVTSGLGLDEHSRSGPGPGSAGSACDAAVMQSPICGDVLAETYTEI